MWHDALKHCQSLGAELASIYNNDDNRFIQNVIKSDSWIGLNDITEAGILIIVLTFRLKSYELTRFLPDSTIFAIWIRLHQTLLAFLSTTELRQRRELGEL